MKCGQGLRAAWKARGPLPVAHRPPTLRSLSLKYPQVQQQRKAFVSQENLTRYPGHTATRTIRTWAVNPGRLQGDERQSSGLIVLTPAARPVALDPLPVQGIELLFERHGT